MTNDRSTSSAVSSPITGGVQVAWLLAETPRSVKTKAGETKTVVELRDPTRLGQSLVLWLDGEADSLQSVPTNTLISLRVDSVRSGRGRGELIGNVARSEVDRAFDAARAGS